MATIKTYTLYPLEKKSQKSPERAATLQTQKKTATAENNMNAEKEDDQSEGMKVDECGPFENTEDKREIHGEQAVITTTSNALSTQTDVTMDEAKPTQHEKQQKDSKVRAEKPLSHTR
jgi:hypothetical protein